mgnify:CR=1 FL=1
MYHQFIYLIVLLVLTNSAIAQNKKQQIASLTELNDVLIANNKLKRFQDSLIINNLNSVISQNKSIINQLISENKSLEGKTEKLNQNAINLNLILKNKQDSIESLKNLLAKTNVKGETNSNAHFSFDGNQFNISKNGIKDMSWIAALFDATYDRDSSEFVWQPNISEQIDFQVENGKKLFTRIDTIFYHGKDKESFTIALNTYTKDENGEKDFGCHGCGQILSLISCRLNIEKTDYDLIYFKKFVGKHGSWGDPGDYSFIEMNDDINFVMVDMGFFQSGVSHEWSILYNTGIESLNFDSGYNDGGAGGGQDWITDFVVDKAKMTITLTKKGAYESSSGKNIKQTKVEKYKVDDSRGKVSLVRL